MMRKNFNNEPTPGPTSSIPWVTSYSRKIEWSYDPTGQEIGRGAFGIIRTATARSIDSNSVVGVWIPKIGEEVVVKHISKVKSLNYKDSVRNEVEIWKALTSHPGFPKLYDIYENKAEVYFVMERCYGGELTDALAERGSLSEKESAAVFQEMVKAVAHMHSKGIIHRDLKPANFLLAREYELGDDLSNNRIVCADFGLAKTVENEEKVTDCSGTLDFMSPEQLGNKPYKGKPTDVWALGCILYMLLCGRLPFGDQKESEHGVKLKIRGAMLLWNPPQIWDNISDSAKNLVRSLMSLDWETRANPFQVLAHPWFKTHAVFGSRGCASLDAMMITQMQEFNSFNVVKRGLTYQLAKQLIEAQRLNRIKDEENQRRREISGMSSDSGGFEDASSRLPNSPQKVLRRSISRVDWREAVSSISEQMHELRNIFDALDEEKTGVVTTCQLIVAIETLGFRIEESELQELAQCTVQAAGPGDQAIGYEAFLAATMRLDIQEYNYFLVQVFQEVDTDEDGCITVEQLQEVIGARTEEHEGDLQKILAQMQLEEDGSIDYIEFLHTFTDNERHG